MSLLKEFNLCLLTWFSLLAMAERLNGSAAFTFSNILLMLWCLCSNSWICLGRTHKRPLCDDATDSQSSREPMSFLWAIKREPPSYFFGTIHVPYTRVWDYIPENTKRAFEISEQVFFELDLTDPYTITALTKCQLLPHGKNISDILPRDIYRRLKRHLDYVKLMMPTWLTADQRNQGMYADYLFNAITGNWERKRPVWVMLMVNSLTESDIKSRGIPVLDLYLAQEAERKNKMTGAVEQVEEQCVPLNGLNISQVLFALNQTLYQHENVRAGGTQVHYTTDDLIKHYNCGDLNTVIFNQDTTQVGALVPSLMNSTLPPIDESIARKIDDYFREELICKRNKRMGERVMELLQAHPGKSFFFAFGAGHFLGNHTVLDVVQNMGFEVEHISVNQKIKIHKRRPRPRAPTIPEVSLLRDFLSNNLEEEDLEEDEEEDTLASSSSSQGGFFSGGVRIRHKQKSKKNTLSFRVAPSASSPKRRNFNDLWVRLDSRTTEAPKTLPQEKLNQDTLAIQRSLRVRYDLPNSVAVQSSSSYASWCQTVVCFVLIRTMASVW